MAYSVLIVEKDLLTRQTLAFMAKTLGTIVVPVGDIELAYNILDAVIFDIVLVSLDRGDKDGTAISVDAKTYQPRTKVIVACGQHRPAELSWLVDEYIQKPFTLKQLDEAITRVLFAPHAKAKTLADSALLRAKRNSFTD